MDVALTKMSSKGQVVIPLEMRKGLVEGENIILIKEGERIVLKRATDLDKQLKEDLEFAKRTEAALERLEKGKGVKMDFDALLEEMKTW